MPRSISHLVWSIVFLLLWTAPSGAEPNKAMENIFRPNEVSTLEIVNSMTMCRDALRSKVKDDRRLAKLCGCVADWERGSKKRVRDMPVEEMGQKVAEATKHCTVWVDAVADDDGVSRSPYYRPTMWFESERVMSAHFGCLQGGKKTDPTATREFSTALCGCIGDAVRYRKGTPTDPFARVTERDHEKCDRHARAVERAARARRR